MIMSRREEFFVMSYNIINHSIHSVHTAYAFIEFMQTNLIYTMTSFIAFMLTYIHPVHGHSYKTAFINSG